MKKIVPVALIACAPALGLSLHAQGPTLVERVWYDGDQPRQVWMSTSEIAVVFTPSAAPRPPAAVKALVHRIEPAAVLVQRRALVAFFRLPDNRSRAEHLRQLKQEPGVHHASPAFYHVADSRSAVALTGELILGFRDQSSSPDAFGSAHDVRLVKPVGLIPNAYIFDARTAADVLTLANSLRRNPAVAFAYPNWTHDVVVR